VADEHRGDGVLLFKGLIGVGVHRDGLSPWGSRWRQWWPEQSSTWGKKEESRALEKGGGGLLYEEAQVEGAGAGTSGACRGGSSAAGSV
jgi:hypothetical protein